MIVIEGPDNSGKSTLASRLVEMLGDQIHNVVESEGPPRYKGELDDRVRRYFDLRGMTLFVRHPCVSQRIYEFHRGGSDFVDFKLVSEFYARRPLLIYCDPLDRSLVEHKIKEHDKPVHLEMLVRKHDLIVRSYRQWAPLHAHIVYRIGDDMERVGLMVKGVIG